MVDMSTTATKTETITGTWSTDFERSEALDGILETARNMSALQPILGNLLQAHVILDTSIIVEDLICLCKTNGEEHRRPAIYELIAKKVFVAYFPREKVGEVEEKCRTVSERYGLPPDVLLSHWTKYRQRLHLVPTSHLELEHADTLMLAGRDPSDVPFLQARHVVGANVVISKDRDILESGAPAMPSSKVLIDLRHYSRKRGLQAAIFLGTGTAIVLPLAAIISFARMLYRASAKVPREALLLAAIGLAAALIVPRSRAFVINAAKEAWEGINKIGPLVFPILSAAMQAVAETEEHAKVIQAGIDKDLPPALLIKKPALGQACYRACLVASVPLTAEEIWSSAQNYGAKSRALDPLRSMRRVLKRHPLLRERADGRWSVIETSDGRRSAQ